MKPTAEPWRPLDLLAAALVLGLLATLVLVRSHFFGFLGDDSSGYLRGAQNLLDGRGYHIPTLGKPDQLLSTWPVGYSTLIALVAWLSGQPVFEASKILGILLGAANLVLLKRIFARDFPWFAPLLLLPPWVEASTSTWSEVPFITGCLWLAVSTSAFLDRRDSPWRGAVWMTLALALMFTSRYIGAFGIAVIAAAALCELYRRNWRGFAAATTSAAVGTLGVAGYLWNNLQQVGHATGMPRLPAPESAAWLASMTVKAHLKQLDVLVPNVDVDSGYGRFAAACSMTLLVLMARYVLRARRLQPSSAQTPSKSATPPVALIGVGGLYLVCITAMRWLSHFDSLSMRLLVPGTLLVLLGLVELGRTGEMGRRLRLVVAPAVAAGLALLIAGDVVRWRAHPQAMTHRQVTSALLARTAAIPSGAILIFGDVQLAYLRADLLQSRPKFRPLHPIREPWDDFTAHVFRHAGNRPVYVFIQDKLEPDRFDPSVLAFMDAHRGEQLVRLPTKP